MVPASVRKIIFALIGLLFLFSTGCARFYCGNCTADLSGTWEYRFGVSGTLEPPSTGTITLNQDGYTFSGSNDSWAVNGTVFGNDVQLTMVVTGEELMGYVLRAEGTYLNERMIATVFTTSDGKSGYWNAYRPD